MQIPLLLCLVGFCLGERQAIVCLLKWPNTSHFRKKCRANFHKIIFAYATSKQETACFFSVPVLHILSGNVYQPSKLCYMNYHPQLCKMKAWLHIRRFLRQIQSCSEWKSYINRAWQHKVHVRQVKAGVAKGEGARFPWYFLSTGGRWGFEHFCFMLISALLRVMMTIILIWVMVIVIVKTKKKHDNNNEAKNKLGNIKVILLILVFVLLPSYSFIISLLHYCPHYIYD